MADDLDLTVVPETFVTEGKPDIAAWRQSYDELAAFKESAPDLTTVVPETFVKDGKPDLNAFRQSYDELTKAGGIDTSVIPDAYKPEGKPDLAAWRLAYDEAAAAKAQADEKLAALPAKPEEYSFDPPEDLTPFLPEGFKMPEGMKLEFDDKDSIDALKQLALDEKMPQATVDKIRDMLVKHNVNTIVTGMKERDDEIKTLGPNAESRLSVVQRSAEGRLPAEQAAALINSITGADALRAVETLMSGSPGNRNINTPGGKTNWGELSINERIAAGLAQRAESRKRA